MKRINRPAWANRRDDENNIKVPAYIVDDWFHDTIGPINTMIDNAVVVYGNDEHIWWYEGSPGNSAASKAYLVGIESIKEETAEDLLREYIEQYESMGLESINNNYYFNKAKKLLENKTTNK